MGLKTIEWTFLFFFCAIGVQNSMSFIQNMREIQNNCAMDGGYCINVIPPPAPRRRNNNRRRGGGAAAGGRMGTRTRTGKRPDPRQLGAQHARLPGSSAGGAGGPPPAAGGAPAYPPVGNTNFHQQNPATGQGHQTQTQAPNTGAMGYNPNDPFSSLMSMFMFTRKKRQVPEPHERPRLRRGENMFNFLNRHCRKTDMDFGCQKEGGMCCLPFLK